MFGNNKQKFIIINVKIFIFSIYLNFIYIFIKNMF